MRPTGCITTATRRPGTWSGSNRPPASRLSSWGQPHRREPTASSANIFSTTESSGSHIPWPATPKLSPTIIRDRTRSAIGAGPPGGQQLHDLPRPHELRIQGRSRRSRRSPVPDGPRRELCTTRILRRRNRNRPGPDPFLGIHRSLLRHGAGVALHYDASSLDKPVEAIVTRELVIPF